MERLSAFVSTRFPTPNWRPLRLETLGQGVASQRFRHRPRRGRHWREAPVGAPLPVAVRRLAIGRTAHGSAALISRLDVGGYLTEIIRKRFLEGRMSSDGKRRLTLLRICYFKECFLDTCREHGRSDSMAELRANIARGRYDALALFTCLGGSFFCTFASLKGKYRGDKNYNTHTPLQSLESGTETSGRRAVGNPNAGRMELCVVSPKPRDNPSSRISSGP